MLPGGLWAGNFQRLDIFDLSTGSAVGDPISLSDDGDQMDVRSMYYDPGTETVLMSGLDFDGDRVFERSASTAALIQKFPVVPNAFLNGVSRETIRVYVVDQANSEIFIFTGSAPRIFGTPHVEFPTGILPANLAPVPVHLDFGDAPYDGPGDPLPDYPTLLAQDGARHVIVEGVRLGDQIDADDDGQPDIVAVGDDLDTALDDEDGVTLLSPCCHSPS